MFYTVFHWFSRVLIHSLQSIHSFNSIILNLLDSMLLLLSQHNRELQLLPFHTTPKSKQPLDSFVSNFLLALFSIIFSESLRMIEWNWNTKQLSFALLCFTASASNSLPMMIKLLSIEWKWNGIFTQKSRR